MSLVNPYIGIPKCQDCGWKLRTDLTDNCPCRGELTPEQELKHKIAYNRAREIQTMNDEPQNHLTLWKDTAVQGDAPPQPVPEEFPLTDSPDPQPILHFGTVPWSSVPIKEVSPLVWFRYQVDEGQDYKVFNVIDGNNRILFTVPEEGMAKFFVNAANIYVHASMTTQV